MNSAEMKSRLQKFRSDIAQLRKTHELRIQSIRERIRERKIKQIKEELAG